MIKMNIYGTEAVKAAREKAADICHEQIRVYHEWIL